jgi:hypothetical protein
MKEGVVVQTCKTEKDKEGLDDQETGSSPAKCQNDHNVNEPTLGNQARHNNKLPSPASSGSNQCLIMPYPSMRRSHQGGNIPTTHCYHALNEQHDIWKYLWNLEVQKENQLDAGWPESVEEQVIQVQV